MLNGLYILIVSLLISSCAASQPSKDSCEKHEIDYKGSTIDVNKEGIGANIKNVEGKYFFSSIVENGPVSKSGLIKIGDEIVEISPYSNGEFISVVGMSFVQLIDEIRGCSKSPLTVKVKRSEHIFPVNLIRERVQLK